MQISTYVGRGVGKSEIGSFCDVICKICDKINEKS